MFSELAIVDVTASELSVVVPPTDTLNDTVRELSVVLLETTRLLVVSVPVV
jgi:hypothetical protein